MFRTFQESCARLKIRVEEPAFIAVEEEKNAAELEQKLLNYMMAGPDSVFRHPKIAVYILDRENLYEMIKKVFLMYQVPS